MILAAATDLQENFGWHAVDQKFLPLIKLANLWCMETCAKDWKKLRIILLKSKLPSVLSLLWFFLFKMCFANICFSIFCNIKKPN